MFGTIDPDLDFFDTYPDMKASKYFSILIAEDKGNEKAWLVLLCNHRSSNFYNLPDADKQEILGKDYLGSTRFFKTKLYRDLQSEFLKLYETPAKRALRAIEEMLADRTSFIKDNKYSDETWEMLEKMNANNLKIFENYEKALKIVEQEEAAERAVGDEEESLMDKL